MVYDFNELVKYNKVNLLSRQISDFDIVVMKVNPINANIFVTAGKENIRFWRIKQKLITGSNVVLNQNGRNKTFTGIEFELEYDEDDTPIKTINAFFCSASGELL